MNHTPKGSQLHIGVFGKRNAGKSTLVNALLGQELSIVSPVAGTTTDSVHKSIEFHPLGPVVFVDTPGIDDVGELGSLRVGRTEKVLQEVDAALWVTVDERLDEEERNYIEQLREKQVPVIVVVNQKNENQKVKPLEGLPSAIIDATQRGTLAGLRALMVSQLGEHKDQCCISDQLESGDVVLLVAPQDIQAPKGRLILPQVQILREILDVQGIPIMTTATTIDEALGALKQPPKLVITDSQVFDLVYKKVPKEIPLTSFSILMARQKGDLAAYVEGAYASDRLTEGDKVLISESCTHNPLHGDIARQKIPNLLQRKLGITLVFEHVAGNDFPEQLGDYKLIVQCGGCMQTRTQVMSRTQKAREAGVPITNFGILLAHMENLLDKVFLP